MNSDKKAGLFGCTVTVANDINTFMLMCFSDNSMADVVLLSLLIQ